MCYFFIRLYFGSYYNRYERRHIADNYFMLNITFSILWSFSSFFLLTYLTLLVSLVTYLIPIICTQSVQNSASLNKSNFSFINSTELLPVFIVPYVILLFVNLTWTAPAISAWFGHVIVAPFQSKVTYLLLTSFLISLAVLTSTTHFSSREVYDYLNTTFSIFYWVLMLFTSNSILTVIFIIEVLSATLFLLIITSTFSSTYFYRNINLSFGHLFQQSTPYTYLQSILFFFWISLISSLNLFLFCILFYTKVLTLDWTLVEYVFMYFINSTSTKDILAMGLSWFILLFCLFLKCGLAPLYVWKPTFFKGIPLYTLFFYITFFYFFLFIYIIHLLTSYFGEIFFFYSLIVSTMTVIGLMMLLCIICESFYIKAFLAMSSILNSLFVFLALSTPHVSDTLLWI